MYRVIVRKDLCKECSICVEFCPTKILKIGSKVNGSGYHYVEVVDEGRCIGCMLCQRYCPDYAIYVVS